MEKIIVCQICTHTNPHVMRVGSQYYIECPGCGCRGPKCANRQEAVDHWKNLHRCTSPQDKQSDGLDKFLDEDTKKSADKFIKDVKNGLYDHVRDVNRFLRKKRALEAESDKHSIEFNKQSNDVCEWPTESPDPPGTSTCFYLPSCNKKYFVCKSKIDKDTKYCMYCGLPIRIKE